MVTDGYDSFINYVLTQTHEEGQVNFSHAFILCNGKKLPTPKQTHPPPKKKKKSGGISTDFNSHSISQIFP